MGVDVNFACKTCKLDVYCGHTNYSKFDSLAAELVEEHKTHDYLTYSTDWTCMKDGHLMLENPWYDNELLIENFTYFKHLDLTKNEQPI